MSFLRKIELDNNDILITLELTKKEYELITPDVKEFLVLPTAALDRTLVTGKIGNGNRIMIPNKFLKASEIPFLKKNVQSRIVGLNDRKILIIELDSKQPGVPVFTE